MSPLVPRAVREQILELVTREADHVGWDHLPQSDKTAKLAEWVEAPEIGGVLKPLLGGDADVRVWLKEVALKKRSRLLQPDAQRVAGFLFPEGFELEDGSAGIKPHHCVVRRSTGRYYICWGAHANAKHLFWAALNARFEYGELGGEYVVIVDRAASVTPPDRKARHERLAVRCGLHIAWVSSS